MQTVLGALCQRPNQTHKCGSLLWTSGSAKPAVKVSLRAIDPEHFAVIDEGNDGKILEEIQESQAFFHVYNGAVYMFQGRSYLCTKLDLEKKIAFVRSANLKYYTQLRDFKDVHVIGGSVAYPAKVGCLVLVF